MRHTISGLVQKPVDAQRIIDATRCLADRSDISLTAQDSAGLGAGAVRAAGEVASAAGSAAASTVSGFGMEHDLARRYSEALRSGSILVIVDAKTENIACCAREVMTTHGATTPETRAEQ